jgi:hypothetical protein
MKTVLFNFEKFPLSVCTQQGPLTDQEKLIPAWIEEDEQGLISFLPYVDPTDIYLSQHNSSIGKTWKDHNDLFARFVLEVEQQSVVDVGGGSGNIYKSYIKHNPHVRWKVIDMNPTVVGDNVDVIQGLYKPNLIKENDTVITSHFLEHIMDLRTFLQELRERNPKYHIFTLPNFIKYAQNNYAATIMFEHPHFLTEEYLDCILSETGWEVVEKKHYKDHSIFFKTKPTNPKPQNIKINSTKYINAFLNYITNRAKDVQGKGPFYVFGAHYPYYYLLNLGIKEDQIIAVVDNDPLKQGKRMYGTNTKVISPLDLPQGANLFVEMGPYNEEIKKELPFINFI